MISIDFFCYSLLDFLVKGYVLIMLFIVLFPKINMMIISWASKIKSRFNMGMPKRIMLKISFYAFRLFQRLFMPLNVKSKILT